VIPRLGSAVISRTVRRAGAGVLGLAGQVSGVAARVTGASLRHGVE
jgi:hypothetical protein